MFKILVVDDMDVTRKTLSRLLQREGYSVVSAVNGLEAIQVLEEGLPDLLLLDIMMPDMDGLQLLEILHDHPQWKALPVVMFSAKSDTHTIHRAEQLGAKAFLVKAAFSIAEVFEIVKRYTGELLQ